MPLLYYWRPDNYLRDRRFGFGYHLNQNSRAMATAAPGDSVWAFTRRKRDGLYALAAELVVRAVTRNPPNYRYGAYRIWGDIKRSRYFETELGPNAEPLIRYLSISARGTSLGQSFQGHAAVRTIKESDRLLLISFASHLPTLARVGIYPEDEFEARLIHGDAAQPRLLRESVGEYSQRAQYLYDVVDVQRSRRNVEHLQELYKGRCQLCLYDPCDQYGFRLCHGHHIQWLSRGGEDEFYNLILLCPNHHAAVHRDDASFDYQDLGFRFSSGAAEMVQLNEHLPKAT